MDNQTVAAVLTHIGTLLELSGENPFKSRAYVNAARTIEGLDEPVETLVSSDRFHDTPGIGEGIRKKIIELVTTGGLAYYEELKASLPSGLITLLEISGLGPRKTRALYQELQIETIEQLETACLEDRVAKLHGFGKKTQANILEGIQRHKNFASQYLLSQAFPAAERIREYLCHHSQVIRCAIAGSLRRYREVVGDVDLLVSSSRPEIVLHDFTSLEYVKSTLAKGETKASVLLVDGVQCDLRIVQDVEFASALLYFTGSKEHNIVMRQRAIERGLRLNEYGLFRSQEETRDPNLRVLCHSEEEIFKKLGLHYIPPELREDQVEFELAVKGPLPRLIENSDLRGSLHNHSLWSDGHQSLEQIAQSMSQKGFSYWAITDHSQSSFQAKGLSAAQVRQQIKEVNKVNQRLADQGNNFRLLTGSEVDILKSGKLDFPDDLLAELDVVIASVHQRLAESAEETTERLVRAAENRYVHILGHLAGRLLLERDPYPLDQRAVIDACSRTGTWIEINASPQRLDLDWRLWPYAKKKGVRCVINCDAHRLEHVEFLRWGVGVARKGGLAAGEVVNTLSLDLLRKELRRKREN